MKIWDKNNEVSQSYNFSYNPLKLPHYHLYKDSTGNFEDFWGYYNGRHSKSSIPKQYFTFPRIFYEGFWWDYTSSRYEIEYNKCAYRTANEYFMKACQLTKIDYPTGGRTEFEFEANKVHNGYDYDPNETIFGGLRIKTIKNYTGLTDQNPTIKTYKYGENESGFGKRFQKIKESLFKYTIVNYYWQKNYPAPPGPGSCSAAYDLTSHDIIMCNSIYPLTKYSNVPVIYDFVTEYFGTETNNIGKTVYQFKMPPEDYDVYEEEFFFRPHHKDAYHWDRGNYKPILLSKLDYKNNSSLPIRETTNNYSFYKVDSFNTGIKYVKDVNSFFHCREWGTLVNDCGHPEEYDIVHALNQYYVGFFHASNTMAYSTEELLTESNVVERFDDGRVLEKTVNYEYENYNLQLKSTSVDNSQGTNNYITYKYPFDFSSSSPYDEMVDKNIISPIIESKEYRYNQHYKTTANVYHYYGSLIKPNYITEKFGNYTTWNTKIRYLSYDNSGNLTSYNKPEDIITSFIWGYNNTYPIANAVNVSPMNIFHTSFEDGNGMYDNNSKTGRKVRTGNISIDISGFANGTYLVTYWKRGGSIWTFIEQTFTKSSGTNSYTLSASYSNPIDEVRIYPSTAMMTTYTYDPLVGMTSSTDENNVTTYYEYDSFGRLQYIKDQDLNIIQEYKYHYKE